MKTYDNEKAIISLTSYRGRINTLHLTLLSLLKQCPGFHVVLVLSSDEFPKKENELPKLVKRFIDDNLIEVIWVKLNTLAFKKMIPTMLKYPKVPIITADDGCVYNRNYAKILYDTWEKDKSKIISFNGFNRLGITYGGGGSGILFPPGIFVHAKLSPEIVRTGHDDYYYGCLSKLYGISWTIINSNAHDTNFTNLDRSVGVSAKFRRNETAICEIIKKELKI